MYGFEVIDIENDVAGTRHPRLKREGNIHHIGLTCGLFSQDPHSISAGLTGILDKMDGDAESFKGGNVEITHTFSRKNWDLETSVLFGKRHYDETHPEFGKTRNDSRYGVETAFTRYHPFGFENFFDPVCRF
jgi:hypothetical protein